MANGKWARVDWRGWLCLAWAIYWVVSYGDMAVRARGQRVLDWFKRPSSSAAADPAKECSIQHQRRSPVNVTVPDDPQRDRLSAASRSQARQ